MKSKHLEFKSIGIIRLELTCACANFSILNISKSIPLITITIDASRWISNKFDDHNFSLLTIAV